MTVAVYFVILAVTSPCVFAQSVPSDSICPTPINCDSDFEPGDCKIEEQGFFEYDGRFCPGCRICIRKGELFIRLLQWRASIPERFLSSRCLAEKYKEAEYTCRARPYNGYITNESGFLYFDVEENCLITVVPSHIDMSQCSSPVMLQQHDQFFYDEKGRHCYVQHAMTC